MSETDVYVENDLVPSDGTQLTAADAPLSLRLMILACICSLTLGSYWVFDTPGAIETQLEDWFTNYSESKNALLYSIYSWPNTVLALFGGFIVDRVTGVRVGALIFCFLVWIGQFTFAVGVQSKSYPICVLGRFIFGLGGESLTVVQNTLVIRWFTGKHLALVFGMVLAFARIGSSINFAVTPTLADSGVPFAIWFGWGVTTFSFLMCILLVILDKRGSKYVDKAVVAAPEVVNSESGEVEPAKEDELPSISQILSFPGVAWVLFFICMFFYQGVLTFYQVASKIMQETGPRYSAKKASLLLAIPNFISIGASPGFGRLVDKFGNAVSLMILACWGLITCHLLFLLNAYDVFNFPPYIILIILGFSYSLLAATLWPLFAHIPKQEKNVSTLYGCATAIQNLGLAVFPLLISALQENKDIKDTPHKYGLPIIIFVVCVLIASLLAILLKFIDGESLRGVLNANSAERILIKEEIAAEEADVPFMDSEVYHEK